MSTRPRSPKWVRIGDAAAFVVIALIYVLGFLQFGFARDGVATPLAWAGCALLGCWAVVGWAAGRWDREECAPAKWLLVLFAVTLALGMIQLFPGSGVFSPLRVEMAAAAEQMGLDAPSAQAVAPRKAMSSLSHLFAGALFFSAVALLTLRRAGAHRLAILVAVASLTEGLLGLANSVIWGGWRASGAIFNANHHAAFVAAGMPIYFALLVRWKRTSDRFSDDLLGGSNPLLLLFVLGGAAVVGWFTAYSRSSFVISLVVGAVWLAVEFAHLRREGDRERTLRASLVVGALCVAVLMAMLFFAEGFLQRLFRSDVLTGNSRVMLWQATLQGLQESGFLGLGLGGAEFAINRHAGFPLTTMPVFSHNDYVQWTAELGLLWVGAALFLVFLFLRKAWLGVVRMREKYGFAAGNLQRAAMAGAAILLIHAVTDFHLRVPMVGFHVLTLIALFLHPGSFFVGAKTGGGR